MLPVLHVPLAFAGMFGGVDFRETRAFDCWQNAKKFMGIGDNYYLSYGWYCSHQDKLP